MLRQLLLVVTQYAFSPPSFVSESTLFQLKMLTD